MKFICKLNNYYGTEIVTNRTWRGDTFFVSGFHNSVLKFRKVKKEKKRKKKKPASNYEISAT